MPLRTRDFESRASAIPPLRHLGTSTARPPAECSKRRRGGLNAAAGGGKPRFNYVTGQAPALRPRSKDGGSRRDAAPTEGRDRGVLDPRFRGDDIKTGM